MKNRNRKDHKKTQTGNNNNNKQPQRKSEREYSRRGKAGIGGDFAGGESEGGDMS